MFLGTIRMTIRRSSTSDALPAKPATWHVRASGLHYLCQLRRRRILRSASAHCATCILGVLRPPMPRGNAVSLASLRRGLLCAFLDLRCTSYVTAGPGEVVPAASTVSIGRSTAAQVDSLFMPVQLHYSYRRAFLDLRCHFLRSLWTWQVCGTGLVSCAA